MALATTPVDSIRDYYGRILASSQDLKSGACCGPDALPANLVRLVAEVHPEVQRRFYGCGVPIPPVLEGRTVLDLGCGTGRDCYVLSQLVGPKGRVVGVDMTPEQLEIANTFLGWHAERFGYPHSNVEFFEGYMEDLGALDGVAPFLVAQIAVMPMMGMPLFSGSMTMAMGSLIGHLIYGAVVGGVYGPVAARQGAVSARPA